MQTIRALAMDAVEKAGSGHPGAPMGLADVGLILWSRFLRFDPTAPDWPDRDRFILSCGHASMLLYALLHLSGFAVSCDDLRRFRQWGSITPGHPEFGRTPGVEATTGPLGQGVGNGVGMAVAERLLAARFNRDGHVLVDHRTWVVASDGDMMEGVASEASSTAGHLALDRLCVIYDDNRITIDGATSLAFGEDVVARYRAYGWHVQSIDGHDPAQIETALAAAIEETQRPSLIAARTRIARGAPTKEGTAASHGSPLGAAEVAATKEGMGWQPDETFVVPEAAGAPLREQAARGCAGRREWETRRAALAAADPEAAAAFDAATASPLPAGWESALPAFAADTDDMATRTASGRVIAAVAPAIPTLVGGSADLAGSNRTDIPDGGSIQAGAFEGRILHFGVREHGMGAILNGVALHRGFIPFGATFLIFSDYMRPAIRLAALSGLGVIYVFSHDSIGVGEDGPTHQPIEQLASLRAIPGLVVIRPADAVETVEAWREALRHRDHPTALVLSRQKLPVLARDRPDASVGVERGAYVLAEASGTPAAILMASGSEVSLALSARRELEAGGVPTRVVSFPSWELFDRQPADYRESVLPPQVPVRLAIEAGASLGWDRFVGPAGGCLCLDRFGASAPGPVLMERFGFTPAGVVARVRQLLPAGC
ncbi:MAG: transketolase [Acidobacteriota bacterium]